MSIDSDRRAFHLIQQAGMLMQMPRSHVRNLGTAFDNIASHCFHVGVISYCIARMEEFSHEEGLKALAMGILHDLEEARTGDVDFVAKHYTKPDKHKAITDQFTGLTFGKELEDLSMESEAKETALAKVVKDADMLAQMYMEWSLAWQGNKLANNWFNGSFKNRVPYMSYESTKKLALAMKDSNPQQWWWDEFVEKDINLEFLNGKKIDEVL